MKPNFTRRIIKLLIFSCFFSVYIFAEEPLKQFQTFSWKPVLKAKSYEVVIQKKSDDGTFAPVYSIKTKDTKTEYLLLPGDYQVQIIALNILGKKASASPWIDFIILKDEEPYLEKQEFPIHKEFSSPVIFLNNNEAILQNEQDHLTKENSEINTQDNIPIFTIKGRNIFFEETKFSLIPRNENPKGTMQLPFVVKDREEVPVEIISRDSENKNLQISFDPEKIHSGYYNLKVLNPSGYSDEIPLLFITGHLPKFEAANPLDYDKQYEAYPVTVVKTKDSTIKLHGYDFEYGTDFQFIPTDGIPYPFASEKQREATDIKLTKANYVTDFSDINTKKQEVTFSLNGLNLETGYYDIIATVNNKKEKIHCLVTAVAPSTADLPTLESIKSKYNKKTKTITLTIEGKNLTDQTKITMVSPSIEGEKVSKKIPLILEKTKKVANTLVLTMEADAEMIEPEIYGLLIDTGTYTNIDFLSFDKKLKAEKVSLTDEEISKLFEFKDKIAETAETLVVSDNPFFSEGNWISSDYFFSTGYKSKANVYIKEINDKQRLVLRLGPRSIGAEGSFNFTNFEKLKQKGTAIRFKVFSPHNDTWKIALTSKEHNVNEYYMSSFKVYGNAVTEVTIPLREINVRQEDEQLQYLSSSDLIDKISFRREQDDNIYLGGRLEVFDFEVIDDLTENDDPIFNEGWVTTDSKGIILQAKEDSFSFSHSKKKGDIINCNFYYSYSTNTNKNTNQHKYTNTSIPTVKALQEADGFSFNIIGQKKSLELKIIPLEGIYKEYVFDLSKNETTTIDINYLENNINKNDIKGLQIYFSLIDSLHLIVSAKMQITNFQLYKMIDGQKVVINFDNKEKNYKRHEDNNSKKIRFDGKISFEETELAYFLPYIGARIGYANTTTTTQFLDNLFFLGEITVFDAKWVGLDIDSGWDMNTSSVEANGKINLALPLISWIKPYVGAGFGMVFKCLDNTQITMQIPIFAGLTLWNWLDLRYDCNLKNAQKLFSKTNDFYPLYFQDKFSIGFKIPIRKRESK